MTMNDIIANRDIIEPKKLTLHGNKTINFYMWSYNNSTKH